ncbi:hypothetical protein COY23_03320 [bacterium (Candidatus Torokbacteria) CG_4_10_14_0_2_um_filter_35_8]|nr:MAG: hypothetical protein COY23_03320 [bacterium (Candidatus Torokbacteria) CG_4_10_14_0_2_um_filter_35_8]
MVNIYKEYTLSLTRESIKRLENLTTFLGISPHLILELCIFYGRIHQEELRKLSEVLISKENQQDDPKVSILSANGKV